MQTRGRETLAFASIVLFSAALSVEAPALGEESETSWEPAPRELVELVARMQKAYLTSIHGLKGHPPSLAA